MRAVQSFGARLRSPWALASKSRLQSFQPPYNSFWERFGPVISDVLVFVGVLGEYLVNNRSQACQEELTRRSNDRLAKAELEAAEARARTAEVEKLTAQRHIPADAEARAAVAPKISKFAKRRHETDLWFTRHFDADFMLSRELIRVFARAGVAKIRWRPNSWTSDPVFGFHWASSNPDIGGVPIRVAYGQAWTLTNQCCRPATLTRPSALPQPVRIHRTKAARHRP